MDDKIVICMASIIFDKISVLQIMKYIEKCSVLIHKKFF